MNYRYSDYSIEQLHREIGVLKEKAQKAEQLGNISEVQINERKMQVALAYTMNPEDFQANEFAVFQAGIDAGADMIMVGHMSAPALTGDNTPCSLSKAVITDILREQMNYKGVIISDALNMSAISEYYSSEQAAVMALKAGCDMILMPENFQEAYEGVLQAVAEGTISEERINDSLRRIYRIKYADKIAEE